MWVPQVMGVWLAVPLCILVALAAHDIRERRLPNELNALLFVSGAVFAITQAGARGAWATLCGALVGLALLGWQHARGLMGAGDVKLLAATGAWTGPLGVLLTLLVAAVLGGAFSLFALAALDRRERDEVARRLTGIASGRAALPRRPEAGRARGIPFGAAIAAAAAWVMSTEAWR